MTPSLGSVAIRRGGGGFPCTTSHLQEEHCSLSSVRRTRATVGRMFPRTFRATSTVVSFWVLVGFATLLVGDSVLRGAWPTVFAYLPPVLLVLWVFWLLLWRTSVRAELDRVIVRNLLSVHEVPWSRVAEVWQRGQVVLELDDARRVICWGAPFPPKPGVPRRARQTTSGRPPATFTDLLEAYRRSAPPSSEPTSRRWDLAALVPGIVLLVATIARVLWVPA